MFVYIHFVRMKHRRIVHMYTSHVYETYTYCTHVYITCFITRISTYINTETSHMPSSLACMYSVASMGRLLENTGLSWKRAL